jgi:hypothetical protein
VRNRLAQTRCIPRSRTLAWVTTGGAVPLTGPFELTMDVLQNVPRLGSYIDSVRSCICKCLGQGGILSDDELPRQVMLFCTQVYSICRQDPHGPKVSPDVADDGHLPSRTGLFAG